MQAERAHAITCGTRVVGIPGTWARQVIDTFELTRVPNAPVWLAGAVNADGVILPVIDLAAWLDPTEVLHAGTRQRLLSGGQGEDGFALLFDGLPMSAQVIDPAMPVHCAPRLLPFVQGAATAFSLNSTEALAPSGPSVWPLINVAALADSLMAELAH
jgi:hypothetical protein